MDRDAFDEDDIQKEGSSFVTSYDSDEKDEKEGEHDRTATVDYAVDKSEAKTFLDTVRVYSD